MMKITNYVLLTALLVFISFVAGCVNQLSIDPDDTSKSTMTSSIEISVTSESMETTTAISTENQLFADIDFQLFPIDDHLYLIPATLDDYYCAQEAGYTDLIWQYNADNLNWNPVNWEVQKINSVTGQYFNDSQTSTFDIYMVKIGNFIGYHLRNSSSASDEIDRRIFEDLITGFPVFQPRSKDYVIMQIFEDIYSIDYEGNMMMVSRRTVDSYDYDSIDKSGLGDLFRWYWTGQPVCCLQNNIIYYLTSRESTFYSIWQLDLDNNTENQFSDDVVIELKGVSRDKLIAVMNPDYSEYHTKLISTNDPQIFTPVSEQAWQVYQGALYCNTGNVLTMEYLDYQIEIEAAASFQPLLLNAQIVWFYVQLSVDEITLLCLDLEEQEVSYVTTERVNNLDGWEMRLTELYASKMSINQLEEQGIRVSVK